MDGWVDRWMDGWMDKRAEGRFEYLKIFEDKF